MRWTVGDALDIGDDLFFAHLVLSNKELKDLLEDG